MHLAVKISKQSFIEHWVLIKYLLEHVKEGLAISLSHELDPILLLFLNILSQVKLYFEVLEQLSDSISKLRWSKF
jgi:hypothetical protein